MPDDDQPGHNGEHPDPSAAAADWPSPPAGPPPPTFPPAQPAPTAPFPLGTQLPPAAGGAPPAAPPPGSPGSVPPAYPPGYAPSPATEPTYQAPPPWGPPAYPASAGYGPHAPPGPPGANGSDPAISPRRPRRRVLTVVVIVLVVALVAAGVGVVVSGGTSTVSSPPGTPASPASRQLLQAALASATRVDAFHYVATSSLSGSQGYTQRTVGDAGPDSGKQVITVGAQRFVVLVIGTACYLKGNAAALTANLGLSSTAASAHAQQWISLARTDAPYASVYAAVTARSALSDNVTIKPQTVSAPTRLAGRRVVTIAGTIAPITIGGQREAPKGRSTLAVRASTPHLPVRYTQRGTQGHQQTTSTVTFSHWGEAVNVSAPSGAVAYSSLGAGSGTVPTTPSGTVLT